MPRQTAAVEVNAFVKGLVTEASPLTFPENASLDEVNLILNKDGSRNRRLGMDYEANYTIIDSQQSVASNFAVSSFVWKSPGGYSQQEIVAIQTGTTLKFFNSNSLPVSRSVLASYTIGGSSSSKVSMTAVDGILIAVQGDGNVYTFDYNGSNITQGSGRLKIRDLFGVQDIIAGQDLLEGSGVGIRPNVRTDTHIYNLRNQTFALPHPMGAYDPATDPIAYFFSKHGVYQANSDNLVVYLYADANDESDRNSRRYFWQDNFLNPLGTNRAPLGYFIIDALDRGASRVSEYQKLMSRNPALTINIGGLPTDRTPEGARVVASYAGRVWYGGFSSQIIGGDTQSPRMTSYILFSRLVQSTSDIYKCYQDGDPTSSETPDLVDTDGGFIRLDGAYNIQYLINVGDALMVVAENGVWKITGGSGYGFKATDYLTSKVTEHGSISPDSVVLIDNTFMYWADDGIYHVSQNQYGDWTASNLTNATIQTYFDDIPYDAKRNCQGLYDSYQRRVRWLYYNTVSDVELARELVLDVNLSAFYPSEIGAVNGGYPKPLSMIKVPPFKTSITDSRVVDLSGNIVTSTDGSAVITEVETVNSSLSEIYYLVATGVSNGSVNYSFAFYKDTTFTDWASYNGTGVDAPAYLLTGWSGMGDFQRQKQVPYITVYSVKTETGFDVDYNPTNPSSVLVQSQWSWTNLESSGKWGQQFQAYRHKRFWAPSSSSDGFDDGEYVVTTRNKLRGRGRTLSLKFSTEPKKDFHLLGWSFIVNVNGSI